TDMKVSSLTHISELKQSGDIIVNGINYLPHLSKCDEMRSQYKTYSEDYSDVNGQLHAKRALMICAAGMHNILLLGPPGTGKTMLVKRLPTILPDMSEQESLEVTKIYSASGK